MRAPFHGMIMSTPRSARQGYHRSNDRRVGLNVLTAFNWNAPPLTAPFLFPPNGGCLNRRSAGELPDNTEGCAADWRTNRWTGIPVWTMIPASRATAGARGEIRLSDGTVFSSSNGKLCVHTKESFRSTGSAGMAQMSQNNGVVLIPKSPFPGGVQATASLTFTDGSTVSWQFYVQQGADDCVSQPLATSSQTSATQPPTQQQTQSTTSVASTLSSTRQVSTTTRQVPTTRPPPSCRDRTTGRVGQCIAAASCRGTRKPGLCSGSSSIQCCFQ